jgi:trans-2,3-dihydro-3-hydroxyanthranilate isomerase
MHELESGGWRAAAFSAGVPFLCIPLSSRAAVAKARLRKSEWSRSIKNSVAPHVYIFSLEDRETIFARMFAPGVGIDEDPATGAAAVALGGYLASYELSGGGHRKYTIHQGAEIGRPSMIDLEVDAVDGALVAVGVGGYGVFLGRGTLASEFAALCSTHFPGRREAATNDD